MFSQHASSLLVLAGVAIAVYLLLRGVRLSGSLAEPTEAGARRFEKPFIPANRDKALADAPDELLRWQVEMHETARDLKAEIDTKFSALHALTALARHEADRLEAALARAAEIQLPCDALAAIEALADPDALADPERLRTLAAELPPPNLFGDNRQTVAIANLAAQGLRPAEIARRLGLPIGEVELRLNLRPA